MFVAATLILLFGFVPQINSECCPGTLGGCGGVGDCDILCCKCDGGCANDCGGERLERAPIHRSSNIQMKDHFAAFDKDADGFISLDEALSRYRLAMQQFASIDEDGDSRVSYAEFEKHA